MAVYDDIYRLGTAAALTVASAAGAAVSTAIFGTETYAIAISFPGSTSSTGGVRVQIVSPTEASQFTSRFSPAGELGGKNQSLARAATFRDQQ